jgi:hypothetical protein
MIRLEVKTKLSPEEAVKQAVAYFGPGGYGLDVKENYKNHAHFEGGGGSVTISTSAKDKKTIVELVSREWDYQVQGFAEKIT